MTDRADPHPDDPAAERIRSLNAALRSGEGVDGRDLAEWIERYRDLDEEKVRREYYRAAVRQQQQGDPAAVEQLRRDHPESADELESLLVEFASTDVLQPHEAATLMAPSELEPSEQATLDANDSSAADDPPAGNDMFSALSMTPGGFAAAGSAATPDQLGDYELLEKLGEGGMGLVYRARQRSADRSVALKIVRPERLQAYSVERRNNIVDRFRTEAQAAAQLEHENIVTVYDVGEVDGQHYYSMRLVSGASLAEKLHDGPLQNRVAAAYVRDTARGIAQAHQRGILHRDLKPQNVMVDDATNRAMVADFGLAKVVDGDTELTRDGEIVGTPQYMAPEQIKDSAHVTASADIYALGATLYHLLTGRPPFQAALAVDTLRQVMLQDPAPPRRLNAAIDLDLETICLKCLEKEPSRRYDSAAIVADELDRYLRGEPILARPLGMVGRAWRWCRRYPGTAGAISAALLGLMLALTATTIGYLTTSAAQVESDRSFRDALATVNIFFNKVSEDSLLHAQGMQPLRKELLTRALEYYQRFLEQRGDDPTLREELAGAYYRIGRITAELESPAKALPFYNQALQIQRELLKDAPDHPNLLSALGNTQNAIGVAHTQQGDLERAAESFEAARQTREAWLKSERSNVEPYRVLANTRSNIAYVCELDGKLDLAEQQYEAAQNLREDLLSLEPQHFRGRRDFAEGLYNLAKFRFQRLLQSGEEMTDQQAEPLIGLLQQAAQIFAELGTEDRSNINVRLQQSQCRRLLGDLTIDEAEAKQAYELARQDLELLTLQNPTVTRYQLDLAMTHLELGRLASIDAGYAEMAANFRKAVELLEPLDSPEAGLSQRMNLAVGHKQLGLALAMQNNINDALRSLDRANQLLTMLCDANPDDELLMLERDECREILAELRP